MGLEISQKTSLNQYEIINHKTNISLWLHDVVDGIIIPGRVTIENLIAGVTLGLDQVYSASDHDHDSDYAALAHNHNTAYAALTHDHDSDYAALAHNHDTAYAALTHNHNYVPLSQGLAICYANWLGNGNGDREITLVGSPLIHSLRALDLLSWASSPNYTLYQWRVSYALGYLVTISSSGVSGLQNQFTFTADSNVFGVVSNLNQSSTAYRLLLTGVRYQ